MNSALSEEPITKETFFALAADLKAQNLIEQNAPVSQVAPASVS